MESAVVCLESTSLLIYSCEVDSHLLYFHMFQACVEVTHIECIFNISTT